MAKKPVGRPRGRNGESGDRGAAILDVSERLFARHGYAAVSMRQIAGAVGVQAGALYNYTPDKQSLLFDLMTSHLEDLLTALDGLDLQKDTTLVCIDDSLDDSQKNNISMRCNLKTI